MNCLAKLVDTMSDGIYHGTTVENLIQIMRSGYIIPARELEFYKPNYHQSALSNCFELGGISCFDFGNATPGKTFDECEMDKWVPLLLPCHAQSRHKTVVIIGFKHGSLDHQSLRYREIKERLGLGGIVPYGIECCYPRRMPIEKSHRILLVHPGSDREIKSVTECTPEMLSESYVMEVALSHDGAGPTINMR